MTLTAIARPLQGLRVLAISPTPTHPTTAGNRSRCKALLDRLQLLGAVVRFVHIGHESGDVSAMRNHWVAGGMVELPYTHPTPRHNRRNRLTNKFSRIFGRPINTKHDVDDWCDPANAASIRAEVARFRPHAVLMTYYWNSSLLEQLDTGILRVLDAQDVFTDRAERLAESGVSQYWYSVPRAEEQRGIERFDVILAIQSHEAEHYRSMTDRKVVTVGHLVPILDVGLASDCARLLIVASDNTINVQGVQWFLNNVWPQVLAKQPEATLHIAGGVCQHLPEAPHTMMTGFVDDLASVYAAATVVVNPLQGGTGLKIKSIEALGAGRPVVSTRSAATGIEGAEGRGMIVESNANEMARAICNLLENPDVARELGVQAREFAIDWNARSERAFDEVFQSALAAAR